MHPSVRLAYLVMPKKFIDPMRAMARHSNLIVSPSVQMVMDEFIQENYLNKHLKNVRKAASERRDIFRHGIKGIDMLKISESHNTLSLHQTSFD